MGKSKSEPHVRIYRHELHSAAYRSLSTDARALLIEMRALYNTRDNRIFLSLREMQRRLGVGRWKAEKARDQLIDRGFVRMRSASGFNQKDRRASEFELLNETAPGSRTPEKPYMRWCPEKNTVLATNTDSASGQHCGASAGPQNGVNGVSHQHCESTRVRATVPTTSTQIDYQGSICGGGGFGQCSCGSPTHRTKQVAGELKLRFVLCGACGRADDFRLFNNSGLLAAGVEAQMRFQMAIDGENDYGYSTGEAVSACGG